MLTSGNLCASPWAVVKEEALNVGALVDDNRGAFPIHPMNLGASFGVLVQAYTGGNITVKLRFGFGTADSATAVNGIDFRNLAAVNQSDFGSVHFGASAIAAPDQAGNPNTTLPPFVTVLITTAVGTQLTYWVLASYLFVP